MSEEILEFIEQLQEWHDNKVIQLLRVTDSEYEDMEINGQKVDAKSDYASGIRTGVSLSLSLLGKLPFELKKSDEEE